MGNKKLKKKLKKAINKANELAAKMPGIYMVEIRHDDWCRHWRGGVCNCDPDVKTTKRILL